MRVGSTLCSGLIGLQAHPVSVEAVISPGLPAFSLIGLPDASLGEARERVRSAVAAAGYPWPQTRVTVNLAPADVPKHGTGYDLAIALAILSASRFVPGSLSSTLVLGELSLNGTVLPIRGLLALLLEAQKSGIRRAVIPAGNCAEAQFVPGLDYVPVRTLSEAVLRLGGKAGKHPTIRAENSDERRQALMPTLDEAASAAAIPANAGGWESDGADAQAPVPRITDLADIIGQQQAKRALEIAAAGNHHLLMTGPPGAGKTLLVRALPGLLPPLTEQEQLEVASIRSICGTLGRYGISSIPPFEAPHHTTSASALVGGGSSVAAPGAITRAHHGVLFLDEAPEFSPSALQALREPMETGQVTLARLKAVTTYPARFLLVMAANPCPCGNDWGDGHLCTCTVQQKRRYWNRLSGPLLDRIDIQLEVPPLEALPAAGSHAEEPSSAVRERVGQARSAAAERYAGTGWSCNAQAAGSWLRTRTGPAALRPVRQGVARHTLSMRGADRTLRLAWTIADLNGQTSPDAEDIEEALMLRGRRA